MAGAGGRALLAAAAALALGLGGGWVAGRASLPPAPPPPVFVNPLASVRKGENLVLARSDGTREQYQVLAVEEDAVLLSSTTVTPGLPPVVRQLRVSRNYTGFFHVIEGDLDPEAARAVARDFVIESMEPAELHLATLARTVRCWKVTGTLRGGDRRVQWISAEFPVHGLIRSDSARGKVWEIESFGEGK